MNSTRLIKKPTQQLTGVYFAVSSGVCFGLLGFFGMTLVHAGLSIANMLFWRFLIATLIAFAVLLPQRALLKKHAHQLGRIILYDSAFYTISALTYFQASQYIGTGLAMVIFFTYPIFTMLFNWVNYRTRIDKMYYFIVPLLFVGLTCLSGVTDASFNLIGIALSLVSAFFYACYIFSSKAHPVHPLVSTSFITLGCTLMYLLMSLFQGDLIIPQQLSIWLDIGGIGLICTMLPILLFLHSLKYLSAVQASMLSVLEPIFVAIFGVLLLHEQISSLQIVGIVLTLSAAMMSLSTKSEIKAS